mmetsp:Transcript_10686/g.23895  ORF Transcript_10686/g.23895 Transcript_10686/m.23895 type:complete len:305 (-) Transcript_10686:435-1349(-)
MGEAWADRVARVRAGSSVARGVEEEERGSWLCRSVIVKSHDDLRQDQLASQLLFLFESIFKEENLTLPLRPYMVVATCADGGLLETLTDAVSIDALKKRVGAMRLARSGAGAGGGGARGVATLAECFAEIFGEGRVSDRARLRFMQSMAGYSVLCYVLHIKDRHNGNIMLCSDGAVAHVDFGIMLNVRYAKDVIEMKIKLSTEFVEVMGELMPEFTNLCKLGYLAVRKHWRQLSTLLEMSSAAAGSAGLPCLEGDAVRQLALRLRLDRSDLEAAQHMEDELKAARQSVRTELLDRLHGWTHANV